MADEFRNSPFLHWLLSEYLRNKYSKDLLDFASKYPPKAKTSSSGDTK